MIGLPFLTFLISIFFGCVAMSLGTFLGIVAPLEVLGINLGAAAVRHATFAIGALTSLVLGCLTPKATVEFDDWKERVNATLGVASGVTISSVMFSLYVGNYSWRNIGLIFVISCVAFLPIALIADAHAYRNQSRESRRFMADD